MLTTPAKSHALNNDTSHSVFIYVLKRALRSHFPALSPSAHDKVNGDWPRWRRRVIYNRFNPFVFCAGLGHCHFCPRGESHHLSSKYFPINICNVEPCLYLRRVSIITSTSHQCPSRPFEHNEMTTGGTLQRSEIRASAACIALDVPKLIDAAFLRN